jgi:nucleotide-binding universal stress UspA family protein
MAAFKHILVATDFSEASRGAIEVAQEMVRDSGAVLTVTHTCELPGFDAPGVPAEVLTPLIEGARKKLDEALRPIRKEVPGASAALRIGVPWEQILALAEEVRADLVIMGTHGRRGLAHALMGSVAERVVRVAPVPVLTVGPRARRAATAALVTGSIGR